MLDLISAAGQNEQERGVGNVEGSELLFYILWSEGGLIKKILLYKDLRAVI